jgi:hypothetical protein
MRVEILPFTPANHNKCSSSLLFRHIQDDGADQGHSLLDPNEIDPTTVRPGSG